MVTIWTIMTVVTTVMVVAIVTIVKTSLLRRLQAQTLPDATPPIGKIHTFSKMAVTFEPMMQF